MKKTGMMNDPFRVPDESASFHSSFIIPVFFIR